LEHGVHQYVNKTTLTQVTDPNDIWGRMSVHD